MRLQKWLVRGLVFGVLLGMAGAALVYQRWTDPATVRQQVITVLQQQFPGAEVTLEAARLRLLGGILLTELRLVRRDDATRSDLAYIPSAVLYYDKEQLLDGVLALRKVELPRPRFRVIHESDGRWNFAGLTKAGGDAALLPTLVVHDGTLVFEDRYGAAPAPPVEITGVQLTVMNDPAATVKFEGTGGSSTLGRLLLHGTWQRDTGQLAVSMQVVETQLTTALVQRVAPCLSKEQHKEFEIKGLADFQFDLNYQPDDPNPLDYDLRCQVRQGCCRHPALPLPLDQFQLDARCRNGRLQIIKATAVSGETKFTLAGSTALPEWLDDLDGSLTVENLPVCKDLCACLPQEVQSLHKLFKPAGPVNLQLDVKKTKERWLKKRCLLRPQNVEVCFGLFPYPVPGVTGWLDADLLTNTVQVDLASTAVPIALTGTWQGGGDDAQVDLHLRANQVPLDDKLLQALPPNLRDLAKSFHPRGWGDLQAEFLHTPGMKQFCNTYQVRVFDASLLWDQFPYPLKNVSGNLTIYPNRYEFQDFRGEHNGGVVTVSGKSIPWAHGDQPHLTRLLMDISGQDVSIDADLRKALNGLPNLGKAWDAMGPAGRLNFHARVDQIPNRPQDLEIAVKVEGCRLEPVFFRYPLSDLSGYFTFRHNQLRVENVLAQHQNTRIGIGKGTVDLAPQGGYFANLEEVQGNPIYPDDGLIQALPPTMQRVFTALNLRDPLVVQTQLIIAQSEEPGSRPDVYWKGRGWLTNVALKAGVDLEHVTGEVGCVGRYDGQQLHGLNGNLVLSRATIFHQPLTNLHCNLAIKKETPDVLVLDVRAPVFGGDVSGEARLDLNSTLRYEMNLTASQIDLAEFGKQNLKERASLQGQASARLHLSGQGTSLATLNGNGTVHVRPGAKLYNLPFLLDLLKFLGLRWPDRTAFEEAFAAFSVHGERLTVNRLNLWGSAVSLTGEGEVNMDGSDVKLDFYPSWARLEQLLPPALRSVTPTVSKNLLKIEVRGRISDNPDELKFHKRPVPALFDPLLELRERVTSVQQNLFKNEAGPGR